MRDLCREYYCYYFYYYYYYLYYHCTFLRAKGALFNMPVMKGLLAPQNTFLDTIANHFDGTRKYCSNTSHLLC